MVYKTAKDRKLQSESHLADLGFKVNLHLPLVEDQSDVKFQSARDIAIRSQWHFPYFSDRIMEMAFSTVQYRRRLPVFK